MVVDELSREPVIGTHICTPESVEIFSNALCVALVISSRRNRRYKPVFCPASSGGGEYVGGRSKIKSLICAVVTPRMQYDNGNPPSLATVCTVTFIGSEPLLAKPKVTSAGEPDNANRPSGKVSVNGP